MAAHRVCKIDGCGKRHEARGWCGKHYQAWKKHGDPLASRPRATDGSSERWIESAISSESLDCLIWPYGRGKDGYGLVSIDGRKERVHRLVCERVHGPPANPSDVARHACGNGASGCANPAHLSWGTQAQNCQDTVTHGRSTRGERNAQAKLTEADVRDIRRLSKAMTHQSIAEMFGVSSRTVGDIVARTSWAWLD